MNKEEAHDILKSKLFKSGAVTYKFLDSTIQRNNVPDSHYAIIDENDELLLRGTSFYNKQDLVLKIDVGKYKTTVSLSTRMGGYSPIVMESIE